MKKSYWLKVSTHTEANKKAALSWVAPLCDDMTVESAAVLCDVETDREKKIKVIAVDKNGKRYRAERTKGGRTFTMTLSPLLGRCNPIPPPQQRRREQMSDKTKLPVLR